jgi:hypothetical protein
VVYYKVQNSSGQSEKKAQDLSHNNQWKVTDWNRVHPDTCVVLLLHPSAGCDPAEDRDMYSEWMASVQRMATLLWRVLSNGRPQLLSIAGEALMFPVHEHIVPRFRWIDCTQHSHCRMWRFQWPGFIYFPPESFVRFVSSSYHTVVSL